MMYESPVNTSCWLHVVFCSRHYCISDVPISSIACSFIKCHIDHACQQHSTGTGAVVPHSI